MIDIHTHLWPLEKTPKYLKSYFYGRDKKSDGYELTCEGILESMDKAEIEKSVVSAISFTPDSTNEELSVMNEYVMDQCNKSGGRLISFCTLNPFEQNAVTRLCKLIEEDRFCGLKLHCNMQEFYPNDRRIYPIYNLMEKYQKPILFHSGGIGVKPNKDRFGQPVYFDDVACDFPDLPIILGHAGRIWYNETAMLLRKHKNVYADISTNFGRMEQYKNMPMEQLFKTVKVWAGSSKHLIFGSDYPFYGQSETVAALSLMKTKRSSQEIVTADEIDDVLKQNAMIFCEKYKLV